MAKSMPIPVLSTVTFKNFLTNASSASATSSGDNILLTDSSGNLKKININSFSVPASIFHEGVSNYNQATLSGFYRINSTSGTGAPDWSAEGGFTPPGILEVRTIEGNNDNIIVTQIATMPSSNIGNPKNGYFIRRFSVNGNNISNISSWKFVPEDIKNNRVATTTAPGIMSTAQVKKLDNLTNEIVTSSERGLMSPTLLARLNATTTHMDGLPIQTSALTPAFYKIAYNTQGHITQATSVTSTDLTDLGVLTTVPSLAGIPASAQTPSFGTSFAIPKVGQATNGSINVEQISVTIPNTLASTETRGLMSTEDKTKINGLSHIHNERVLLAAANSASPSSIIFPALSAGNIKARITHIYNSSGDHALGLLTWGTLSNSNVVFNYTFIGGNQLFMGSSASHVPGSSGTGLYFNKNNSGGLQIFNHTGSSIYVDFYGMSGTKFDAPTTVNSSTAYLYN